MSNEQEAFLKSYKRTLSIRKTVKEMGLKFHRGRMLYELGVRAGEIQARPRREATNEEIKQAAAGEDVTPVVAGRLKVRKTPKAKLQKGTVTRFLLTCAQNNTNLHERLWENIQALAKHYDARILIARTVYNRFADAAEMDKKLIIGSVVHHDHTTYHWDDRLESYFYDERLELAPGLVWCGETNIIPTTAHPLTGFETYTGRASAIVPHARIAMRSVASHYTEGTKLLFTTGTLTMRNYIQRKAGQMAEFHHCYGALLVEVDADGTWFTRQVNADSDGVIHDWDVQVADGKITTGNRIEAITWGDIHVAYGDPITYELAWGEGGMLDQLRPQHQFIHDLMDFRVRNPHNIKRNLNLQAFVEYTLGHRSVRKEMQDCAAFLQKILRGYTNTLVVSSNHDNFLVEWLERTGDFRKDPENAVYFLEAATHLWRMTEAHGKPPNMTRWAMTNARSFVTGSVPPLKFLDEDQSFIICKDAHGGLECGMHGHQGPNGTRGTVTALAKIGRKANIGHHHSAGIYDGLYVAGIMGSLDQGYNSGPGSWSQSNIITYPNGKRAIQTIYDGKIRAT